MEKVSVSIYRAAKFPDCTGGGLTSRVTSAWLFSDATVDEIVEYCKLKGIDPREHLMINRRILWGEPNYFAEPVIKERGNQQFGGNFVYTSDAMFKEIVGDYRPLPVHDRFEIELNS